jgi:hypothetical protein
MTGLRLYYMNIKLLISALAILPLSIGSTYGNLVKIPKGKTEFSEKRKGKAKESNVEALEADGSGDGADSNGSEESEAGNSDGNHEVVNNGPDNENTRGSDNKDAKDKDPGNTKGVTSTFSSDETEPAKVETAEAESADSHAINTAMPDFPNMLKNNLNPGVYLPMQLSEAQMIQRSDDGNNLIVKVLITIPQDLLVIVKDAKQSGNGYVIDARLLLNQDVPSSLGNGKDLLPSVFSEVTVSEPTYQVLRNRFDNPPNIKGFTELGAEPRFIATIQELSGIDMPYILVVEVEGESIVRVEIRIPDSVQNLIALQGEANTILAQQVGEINNLKKSLRLDDEALVELDKISAIKMEIEELEKQKNEINEKLEKHPALKVKEEETKATEEKYKKDADALAAEKEKLIKEKEDAGKGMSSGPNKEEVEKAEKALKDAEEAVESAKNSVNNAQSTLNSTPPTVVDYPNRPVKKQKKIPNPAYPAAQNNFNTAKSKLDVANKDRDKAKEELETIKNTKTGPSPEEIEKKKNEIDEKIKANEAAFAELENNKKEKIKEIDSRCDENEDLKTLKAESDRITSTLYAKKGELEGKDKSKYNEVKLAALQDGREDAKKALNNNLEQWIKKAKEALSKIPSDLTNNSDKLTKLVHVVLCSLAKIENKSARDIAKEIEIVLSDPSVMKEVKEDKDLIINALSSEIAEKAMSE